MPEMSEGELHRRIQELIDEEVTDGNAGFGYLPEPGETREGDHDLSADLTDRHYTAGQQTSFPYSGPYSRSYSLTDYDGVTDGPPTVTPSAGAAARNLAAQAQGRRMREPRRVPAITEIDYTRITVFGVALPTILHPPLVEAIGQMGWDLDPAARWELADALIVALHAALTDDPTEGLMTLDRLVTVVLNVAGVPRHTDEHAYTVLHTLLGWIGRGGAGGMAAPVMLPDPWRWDSTEVTLSGMNVGQTAAQALVTGPRYLYSLGRMDARGARMRLELPEPIGRELLRGLPAAQFAPLLAVSVRGASVADVAERIRRIELARQAPRPLPVWTQPKMMPGGFLNLIERRPLPVVLASVGPYDNGERSRVLLRDRLALRFYTTDPDDPLRIIMLPTNIDKQAVLTAVAMAGLWLNLSDATTWALLEQWWPSDGAAVGEPEQVGATDDWARWQEAGYRYGGGG